METIRGRAFSFNSEKLNPSISQPIPEIRGSRNDPNSLVLLTDYAVFQKSIPEKKKNLAIKYLLLDLCVCPVFLVFGFF